MDSYWTVWDGSKQVLYDASGLAYKPEWVNPRYYASTDCTGTILLDAPVAPHADGTPLLLGVPDPLAFDGWAFYEFTTPSITPTIINSVVSLGGNCLPATGIGSYQIALGAKVQRPALPLTPVVVP
jgi:hypothetical protein